MVDPGLSKQKVYNPRLKIESLLVSPISRASAKQRAGRAGRTRPGKCYRLFTEKSFTKDLKENTYPEIQRSNLSAVVLYLKKLGIHDIVHFDYMDPPAPETLMRAMEQLHYIGALNDDGDLTDLGFKMSELPLDPVLAKCVLTASSVYQCMQEALAIVAMLNVPAVFLRPRDNANLADDAKRRFQHNDGDHLTLLKAFTEFQKNKMCQDWCWKHFLNFRALKQACDIKNQLEKILRQQGCSMVSRPVTDPLYYVNVRKCLLSGFFMQCAAI